MFENAKTMLRNASIIDALVTSRDKELKSIKESFESIINFEQNKEKLTETFNKVAQGTMNNYNNILSNYLDSMDECEHEILFYIEDEERYVCACCGEDALNNNDALIINITSEQYNNPNFISQIRSNLIAYFFYESDCSKEQIETDLPMIMDEAKVMKRELKKKGVNE